MLCNNVSLIVQRFEHNALPSEFPGAVSSLNLLEASYIFREYLKFINSKAASRVRLIIFIALMVSLTTNGRA